MARNTHRVNSKRPAAWLRNFNWAEARVAQLCTPSAGQVQNNPSTSSRSTGSTQPAQVVTAMAFLQIILDRETLDVLGWPAMHAELSDDPAPNETPALKRS